MSSNSIFQTLGLTIFIAGVFFGICGIFPMILGFSTIGITKFSFAAFFQSLIGNVASGSLFAKLTSLGMKGFFSYFTKLGTYLGIGGLFTYLKCKGNK